VELISIFRTLWRRRRLAAIGLVIAAAVGYLMIQGASQTVGQASARLLVQLPQTQFVHTTKGPPPPLEDHAQLLADLALTDGMKNAIAQRAHVPADLFVVNDAGLISPSIGTPLPLALSEAEAAGGPYTLTVSEISDSLPLIKLAAQSPDAQSAGRIVDAAAALLQAAAHPAGEPPSQALSVSLVSPPRLRQFVQHPRKMMAVAGGLFAFVFWCVVVLLLPGSRRRRPRKGRRLRTVLMSRSARRKSRTFAICMFVGTVAAIVSISTVTLSPPFVKARTLSVAGAETHLMLDTPPGSAPELAPYSTILGARALTADVDTLTARASLLGSLMITPDVIQRIAARSGIPADEIDAYLGPIPNVPIALSEPSNEKRGNQIVEYRKPYVLEIQPRPTEPIVDIYAQAPSPWLAQKLANAVIPGLQDYVKSVSAARKIPSRLRLLQLGAARGTELTTGTKKIAGLTFFVFAGIAWAIIAIFRRWRRRVAASRSDDGPAPAVPARGRFAADSVDIDKSRGGDWPHTTRVLPWMLAFFIAMVWLVPFDQIELNASLPISLPLDRLVLPFIMGTWALSLVGGGRWAPRVRFTWIHAAVYSFLLCCLLSVVLNAPDLNHTLELGEGLKRIPLFVSYFSLFIVFASTIRRSEVEPFLKYILWLALLCALGMVVEYRFKYNVFFAIPQAILPSSFVIGEASAGGVDGLGRRLIQGPTGHPLEAVSLLTIGVCIALVQMMRAERWSTRIWYILGLCLLFGAMVATYRKSALVVPLTVVVCLAAFRPRQVFKMAPLALVLFAGAHVFAPGALGSVTEQLNSNRLNVPTVDDRVVRYDAVRPDVWDHLAFGRGLGTYDHVAHRILDSEVLDRVIETGVLGLLTFFLMPISVLAVAVGVIRKGDPTRAPPALIGAACATSFAVASTLYDMTAYPHTPYMFLCMAGIVAVVSEKTPEHAEASGGDGRARPRALRRPGVPRRPAARAARPVRALSAAEGPSIAPAKLGLLRLRRAIQGGSAS
jgi:hypothetical protein